MSKQSPWSGGPEKKPAYGKSIGRVWEARVNYDPDEMQARMKDVLDQLSEKKRAMFYENLGMILTGVLMTAGNDENAPDEIWGLLNSIGIKTLQFKTIVGAEEAENNDTNTDG